MTSYRVHYTNMSSFARQFRPRRSCIGERIVHATATAATGSRRRCGRPSCSAGVPVAAGTTVTATATQLSFGAFERLSMTSFFVAVIATTTVTDGRQQPPLQFLEDAFVCLGLETR